MLCYYNASIHLSNTSWQIKIAKCKMSYLFSGYEVKILDKAFVVDLHQTFLNIHIMFFVSRK